MTRGTTVLSISIDILLLGQVDMSLAQQPPVGILRSRDRKQGIMR